MKPPFTRTSCALIAMAALAITGVGTASATSSDPTEKATTHYSKTTGDLVSTVQEVDGQIISSVEDQETGEPIELDENQLGPQLVDGVPNGGAVMGQSVKSEDYADRAAAASDQTAEVLDGKAAAASSSLLGSAAFTPNWGTLGVDISYYQGENFNWTAAKSQGARYVYIKATEGLYYPSTRFPQSMFDAQWAGATQAGLIRGAYHFANPSWSSGASQADHFIKAGGGWSADGRTLPGLLDMEASPYEADQCYGLSQSQMVSWIKDFSNRYKARTGRLPAIYTGAYWWNDCTGSSRAFNDHPLHIAAYGVTTPQLYPAGWSTYDLWQYSEDGIVGGDSNVFNGSYTALQAFAKNAAYKPVGGTSPVIAPAPAPAPAGYTVKGGIGSAYRALGGSAVFGTPTMNEKGGLVDGGVYQKFSKGYTIYWSKTTNAWPVKNTGAIGRKFADARWENGYGYPSNKETCGISGGGCYQNFRTASGVVNKILWSPATGTGVVKETGAIGRKWKAAGHENGYGYPTTEERTGLINGGAYQVFTKGAEKNVVTWAPGIGAHTVKETGPIGKEWRAAGSERGYGYPTTEEYRVGDELRQDFSKDFTVHYSTTTKQTWISR